MAMQNTPPLCATAGNNAIRDKMNILVRTKLGKDQKPSRQQRKAVLEEVNELLVKTPGPISFVRVEQVGHVEGRHISALTTTCG